MITQFHKGKGSSLVYEDGSIVSRRLRSNFDKCRRVISEELHLQSANLLVVKNEDSFQYLDFGKIQYLLVNEPLLSPGILSPLMIGEPYINGILFRMKTNDEHLADLEPEKKIDSRLYGSPESIVLLEIQEFIVILDTLFPSRKRIVVSKDNSLLDIKDSYLAISESLFIRMAMNTSTIDLSVPGSGLEEIGNLTDINKSFPTDVVIIGKDEHRITWQITSRRDGIICAYNDIDDYRGKIVSPFCIEIDFNHTTHIGTYDYVAKEIKWDNNSTWSIVHIEPIIIDSTLSTWDVEAAYHQSIEKAMSGDLVDIIEYHPALKILANELIKFSHQSDLSNHLGNLSDVIDRLKEFLKQSLPRTKG